MTEKEALFMKVCEKRFAAHEISLFLDTHPNDKRALSLLSKYRSEYKDAKGEYEEKFGMLDVYAPTSENHWDWVSSPWPWQEEKEN